MPRGGGTVNQYSETEAGGLTLSDWVYTETSDKITLTKYKGDQVNVVIPSEFEGQEGKTVEIKTFYGMFENLKKEDSSDEVQKYNELEGNADKKDLIKILKVNVKYTINEKEENFEVTRLITK